MTRKQITEMVGIPASSLSDWSKKDNDNWRKLVYIILKNLSFEEANKLIEMGDIENMSLEEMDEKIHLYMNIEEEK